MADKKGKPGEAEAPPPQKGEKDPEEPKKKSEQPKDEVGTRKGCRRYKWEFKDSNKEFWSVGHAEVKLISLACLIGSLVMFTGSTVHPLLTLIITMEISIFIFFFIIYTFAIQRYLPFILWPISDLLNDLFCCGFLVGAAVFALRSRQTVPTNYLAAVVFLCVAALFALVDVCLQKKHFKGKKIKRNVLVPPPPKEPEKPVAEVKPVDAEKKKEAGKPKEAKAKGAAGAKGGKK
ncbi:CKLF-like MARVEL transmembrane domain-containing protein 2 isoform X2 [Bos indicus]|uniref:CKLF-like MARVEL transmembrane domain containing 2 n=3 Tax=Bos TaxID=9903 RepID=Q32LC5_BOVIN|nr:CKLF-like MARVEL transmembrane domain-containing protein 2 [Bos taurus]AAI09648.1 CKLF-like MARVEL transmembrane domain containing 2 [Bos taurus]DAA20085.1 TPA: CKLF-like MARVEL transmembrane domain containing 2 [Bos taurus]